MNDRTCDFLDFRFLKTYFSRFFENVDIFHQNHQIIANIGNGYLKCHQNTNVNMMKHSNIFKKSRKIFFQNSEIQKIECTVIINTFSQHIVSDSTRFSQRQARKLVHNGMKIFFANFIG